MIFITLLTGLIGKIVEIMLIDFENVSIDKLEPELSWVEGVPGLRSGGPPLMQFGPLDTWRRVPRTIMLIHVEND